MWGGGRFGTGKGKDGMAKLATFVDNQQRRRAGRRRPVAYRAVTLGDERGDWAVLDVHGSIVWRGEARVAAMIATRLTRQAR